MIWHNGVMSSEPRRFALRHDPKAEILERRYPVTPPARDITVATTVIQLFKDLKEAARCALKRSGFGQTDLMAGILYAHQLDDHDREVDGLDIPPGHVQVYVGAISPESREDYCFPEALYLEIIKQMLVLHEEYEMAAKIKQLQDRLGRSEDRPFS